uniref:2Fe-2S ferredoxin-type domain-containing protein n=1 Tax=Helicotheca tamesis TaxID=374047 RepID=A0A7S2IJ81_9STRA|mmetsp:Transcript_9943/g.13919  ORF Transcript_9943/g.13919 Transcript_9943/m.13919 type:complete len:372 (+) Transcript_9943:127-1242(+)
MKTMSASTKFEGVRCRKTIFSPISLLTLLGCAAYQMNVNAFLLPKTSSTNSPSIMQGYAPPKTIQSTSSDTDVEISNSAASRYTGAGTAAVDMNKYNLPIDQIASEWTANLQAQTSMQEGGVYLGAKSKKEVFADTLKFEVKRAGGLGIELLELAGGREDGLGITIVSGLVEGGNAEGSGIIEGDSIVQLTVMKKGPTSSNAGVLSEVEEQTSVSTECLGYDATVDSIINLPDLASDDETVMITVKRLRRMPKVTVKLQFPPSQNEPDATIELFAGENLRRAMLTRGVKLNDALSRRFDSGGIGDCGSEGTCATCVVSVSKGDDLLNDMNLQEQQILAKNPRWRLACRAIVGHGMKEGDMTIQVNPRRWDE